MTSELDTIADGYNTTVAAGSARIRLVIANVSPSPPIGRRPLQRALVGLIRRALSGPVEGHGVIDFAKRRYLVDYDGYAVLYEDGVEWAGPSGSARGDALPSTSARPLPLWLIDVLDEAIAARPAQSEEIVTATPAAESTWAVEVDLASFAEKHPEAGIPALDSSRLVRAFPLSLTLEDRLITAVRATIENQRASLHLADHGLDLETCDWDRLPGR